MNMLFLDEDDLSRPLARDDARARHIVRVLKKGPGDELAAGAYDGSLGTARIESIGDEGIMLSYSPEREAPPLRPVTLLLGFPRPIQANRILKDLASLGVARIVLSGTELGEKSYMESDFFRRREFRPALIEGAVQAGNPRLPEVLTAWTLARALEALDAPDTRVAPRSARLALDPYRASGRLSEVLAEANLEAGLVLAIGSERGWTEAELDRLAASGFAFASLGDRILKTETAAVAAIAMAMGIMGVM